MGYSIHHCIFDAGQLSVKDIWKLWIPGDVLNLVFVRQYRRRYAAFVALVPEDITSKKIYHIAVSIFPDKSIITDVPIRNIHLTVG